MNNYFLNYYTVSTMDAAALHQLLELHIKKIANSIFLNNATLQFVIYFYRFLIFEKSKLIKLYVH